MVVDKYKLLFPSGVMNREQVELTTRGYINYLFVETPDGLRLPLYFIDPQRISRELVEYTTLGIPCLAEPGLIVLPSISKENIEQAFIYLVKSGYFTRTSTLRIRSPHLPQGSRPPESRLPIAPPVI